MRARSRTVLASIGLALTCLGLSGCGDPSSGQPHPTLADLQRLPEASLRPAGAVETTVGGSDSNDLMGGNPAILGNTFATPMASSDLLDWYDAHLGDRWTRDDNAGTRRTDWSRAEAWVSDRYVLQIGIDDPSYRRRYVRLHPEAARLRTLYAIQIQARPASAGS